uniref:7-keto-8-aminopelargonate synthetase n=1 Tax=Candidatus Kentrum sp. FW TaxID=2126338 RepID=A0A450T5R4_9GAMM|nr:MAG: 7-keto-8-aminopelargonate synthetase [Candidatus Kentron sp. FW]
MTDRVHSGIGDRFPPEWVIDLLRNTHWLQAISHYKATTSGGPNFAYDLCVEKVTAEQRAELELGCWTVAYNGAEPVRAETLKRFTEAFTECGFRGEAFYPTYGMAETTLFVSGGLRTSRPVICEASLEQDRVLEDSGTTQKFVGCGKSWLDQRIVVVDPEPFVACPDRQVGEIWVSGKHIAQGYWNRPEETEQTFQAHLADTGEGPFLRTGDLGFLRDGDLFVTGRLKDLIIIHGQNHYPQDIELTVEQVVDFVKVNGCAATSITVDGKERLVMAMEASRDLTRKIKAVQRHETPSPREHSEQSAKAREDLDRTVGAIAARARAAVAEKHEIALYALAFVDPRGFPRTSSGKVQRRACRALFLEEKDKPLFFWHEHDETGEAERGPDDERSMLGYIKDHDPSLDRTRQLIHDSLVSYLEQAAHLGVNRIDYDRSFISLGIDFLGVVSIRKELERIFDRKLSLDEIHKFDTINKLAAHIGPVSDVYRFENRDKQQRPHAKETTLSEIAPSPAGTLTTQKNEDGDLQIWILEWVAKALKTNIRAIDPNQSLSAMGFNSVMAVEFTFALEKERDIQLSVDVLWRMPSIRALVDHLGHRRTEPKSEQVLKKFQSKRTSGATNQPKKPFTQSRDRLDTLNQVMMNAENRGMIHNVAEDDALTGKTLSIDGRDLINFGSCSYLGLEFHHDIIHGIIEATRSYGSQFSSSRAYVSLGLYDELEQMLETIYGKPVIVMASTTLGHLSALTVIVDRNDAVILDLQVHTSVQIAVQLLKADGVAVHVIQHNDMDRLDEKISQLRGKYKKIWYMADGVYSMFGDFAPLDRLEELLNIHEQFHLYIDDAHGMSWIGQHGCGYVRSRIAHHPKMVLAISLNKSFAAAGGAIVFPDHEMARWVKNCGGTFIFSGPIQPPMLGAAHASARLHLSDEIIAHQNYLKELIDFTNRKIADLSLPQYQISDSPLFFVPVGLPRVIYNLMKRLLNEGYYLNSASFPATPMQQGGVRFMITGNLDKKPVGEMLDALRYHYPLALAEENHDCDQVARTFGIPSFDLGHPPKPLGKKPTTDDLTVQLEGSIDRLDPTEWDSLFAHCGNFTHSSLRLLEKVFAKNPDPANCWDFHYCIIRDREHRLVLATYFTVGLIKEDMFATADTSKKIEKERATNPDYLISRAVSLGSPITKGAHLYLDRNSPYWRKALASLIEQMQRVVDEKQANQLMLRDFMTGNDDELKESLLEMGLTEIALPNVCVIDDMSWENQGEYLQRLGQKYRYNVRKEILAFEDLFIMRVDKPSTFEEVEACFDLYTNVQRNAFELNVFPLPISFFEEICRHPDYDVLRLYLKEQHDGHHPLVATMFSFVDAGVYSALIVGLDYEYLYSHKIYKQILYKTVHRAHELGCKKLDLAYTAELEKKKIGARPYPVCAYVRLMDHFNQAVLASMS